jgi:hypothetical protein
LLDVIHPEKDIERAVDVRIEFSGAIDWLVAQRNKGACSAAESRSRQYIDIGCATRSVAMGNCCPLEATVNRFIADTNADPKPLV